MGQRTMCVVGVLALGVLSAVVPQVAAQEAGEPLTWLVNVTVKPGKHMELMSSTEKYDKPVLDRLVAEGAIQSWGLACQMVGPPGESCMFWVTAADWAGMSKVEKAYDDSRKAMTEDELKAMMDSFTSTTELDKETSTVIRHVVIEGTPGGTPGYLLRHVYSVTPGKGGAATKMFKEYTAPTYQKLLDAGTIQAYGMAVPEMHTGGDWTHTSWVMFSEMPRMDAIDAAFAEADDARDPALSEALQSKWMELHDMDAHFDSLMKVSMYGGR